MKYILFICIRNAGRSQMTQGIFNHYKKTLPIVDRSYEAISAGITPSSRVGSTSSEVMKEIGIDMSDSSEYYPKKVDEEMLRKSEMVICLDRTINNSDLYGYTPDEIWDVEDTYNKSVETIRGVRKDIRTRCANLFETLYRNERIAATL